MNRGPDPESADEQRGQTDQPEIAGELVEKLPQLRLGRAIAGYASRICRQPVSQFGEERLQRHIGGCLHEIPFSHPASGLDQLRRL